MRFVSIFFISIFLSSCASKPVIQEIPKIERKPHADDMVECVIPNKMQNGNLGELVRKLDESVSELQRCKDRHKNLVDFINSN